MFTAEFVNQVVENFFVMFGYESIQTVIFDNVVETLRKLVEGSKEEGIIDGKSVVEAVVKCLPSVEDLQGKFWTVLK